MMKRKTTLITATGSGIGVAIARNLAEKGGLIGILSSSGKGEVPANEPGGFGVIRYL